MFLIFSTLLKIRNLWQHNNSYIYEQVSNLLALLLASLKHFISLFIWEGNFFNTVPLRKEMQEKISLEIALKMIQ